MKSLNDQQLKQLIEAALFVADCPLAIKDLQQTVLADCNVSAARIAQSLEQLTDDYQDRGVQLVNVAGGYRFKTLASLSPYLSHLWEERAPRYSRALLETLALVAYRQPITRGEIERVRGVSVSSNILRTLTERGWIKAVGHKEVPGRPALYATTDAFLHYFCLDSLASLPPLEDEGALNALMSAGRIEAEPQVH